MKIQEERFPTEFWSSFFRVEKNKGDRGMDGWMIRRKENKG
jgi:hypothetical protein